MLSPRRRRPNHRRFVAKREARQKHCCSGSNSVFQRFELCVRPAHDANAVGPNSKREATRICFEERNIAIVVGHRKSTGAMNSTNSGERAAVARNTARSEDRACGH
jgi:hypothetical protein